MKEIWKAVSGFEGLYEVSNIGNVRSLDRTVTRKDGVVVSFKGKQLLPRLNHDGYLQVQISKCNKCKTVKVHRLVADAFMPNPLSLPEINHKDENKTNNAVTNLEWCSHKYNSCYGTRGERIGEKISKPLYAYVPGNVIPTLRFKSISAAARHFEVTPESVRQALLYGWKCRGYILKNAKKG